MYIVIVVQVLALLCCLLIREFVLYVFIFNVMVIIMKVTVIITRKVFLPMSAPGNILVFGSMSR